MNIEKALSMLQARRADLLGELRLRLHAEGETEQLALVNHLDETGDWAEASSESLHDLALLQHEIVTLRGLDDALQRVHSGQYGICQECGEKIPDNRLEVQPEAMTCLQCQQKLEQHLHHA